MGAVLDEAGCNDLLLRRVGLAGAEGKELLEPPIVALVVEDDAFVRCDLVEALTAAGFKTFEADNATRAIKVLEANSDISVVFTDIQMPGDMDGLALSQYVRERWPPTIIIISSGRYHPEADEMPKGARFLGKPYHSQMLGDVLQGIRQQLS
jgi:DNA-binding NtrC family response regulator